MILTHSFSKLTFAVLLALSLTAQQAQTATCPGHPDCLNDTGITSFAVPTTDNQKPVAIAETEPPAFPRQDASLGRDATEKAGTLNKKGGGDAGFDFTRIANNGDELPATSTLTLGSGPNDWACTRDNVTGLIWEVKTADGARGQNNTYTWYNSNSASNGGYAGAVNGGDCTKGPLAFDHVEGCSTQKYVEYVNKVKLCIPSGSASNWRLPGIKELVNVAHLGKPGSGYMDPNYFPNSPSGSFWTGTFFISAGNEINIWNWNTGSLRFGAYTNSFGAGNNSLPHPQQYIRLVRDPNSQSPVDSTNSICSYNAQSPDANYVDHGDGTVTQIPTGLMWRHCPHGAIWDGTICSGGIYPFNWPETLSTIAKLDRNGYSDWRVPNLKELFSLVEECRPPARILTPSQWTVVLNLKNFPNQKGDQTTSDLWSTSFSGSLALALEMNNGWMTGKPINACPDGSCGGYGASILMVRDPNGTTQPPCTSTNCGNNSPPSCSLIANPINVTTVNPSSTLTASCNPAATTYSWTGGSCVNNPTSTSVCTVTPTATTDYSVTGTNANGPSAPALATVSVGSTTTPGDPTTCTYTLSVGGQLGSQVSLPATFALANFVNVGASPTTCMWNAISNDTAWLKITNGNSGPNGTQSYSGPANVIYSVDPNPNSSPRNGTITIAGQTFTVVQAANTTVVNPQPSSPTSTPTPSPTPRPSATPTPTPTPSIGPHLSPGPARPSNPSQIKATGGLNHKYPGSGF